MQLTLVQVILKHDTLGKYHFMAGPDESGHLPEMLFTENETNSKRLFDVDSYTPYVKDAFHRHVINNEKDCVDPKKKGTKVRK